MPWYFSVYGKINVLGVNGTAIPIQKRKFIAIGSVDPELEALE